MSAIVVGTYVCALYGAFGTPVKAKPPSSPRQAVIANASTRPAAATQPGHGLTNVADVSNAR